MKNSPAQNNICDSVGPTPTTNPPLSHPYLHTDVITREDGCDKIPLDTDACDDMGDKSKSINVHCPISGQTETVNSATLFADDPAVVVVNTDSALDSRPASSSVTSGVSAALTTLAKHCPPQLGWKDKSKRRHSATETEAYPGMAKGRQLIGPLIRQEEVLLAWLSHALIPSDARRRCTEASQGPCDSEVASAPKETVSHVSIKRRKTAHRVSLTSIPEADQGWSYWLTRPLRKPWTFGLPASSPSRGFATSAAESPPSNAYASCFASPHRPPSVIHWKFQ